METNIIGHFDIYPITLQTKQVFLLRMLTPLAEYQVNIFNMFYLWLFNLFY